MTQAKKYCVNCFYVLLSQAAICDRCQYEQPTEDSPLYLQPPFRLNEQFYIGRVLGHGGFAITYLAYDRNLGLPVAIKEYFPIEFATRDGDGRSVTPYGGQAGELFELGREKFLHEARLLANFRSPHIIKIRQFFRAAGTAYFVMEYLDGCTFSDYLQARGGKLSFAETRRILLPLLDALDEVHHKHIFHRDIKPDNIYISSEGLPILLDFGAARQSFSGRTTHIMAFLTPGFAPAEQYSANGIQGPWTDIYSLAATMYFALTGQLPPPPPDQMMNEAELIPPSRLGSDIPPEDEEWLLQALALKWSQRPDSIAAWRKLIEHPIARVIDLQQQVRTAEENFTRIAILPKLQQKLLSRRDEQEIRASAAFMEISLERVMALIEAALEETGSRRSEADEEVPDEAELQQRADELKRKEEELRHFEDLRSKEEAMWWEAEQAELEAQQRQQQEAEARQQQEALRLEQEKIQQEQEKMQHEQALRAREAELERKASEMQELEARQREQLEQLRQAEEARLEQEKQRLAAEEARLRQLQEELEKQRRLEAIERREAELRLMEEQLRRRESELKPRREPVKAQAQPQSSLSNEELDDLEDISADEVADLISLFADKPKKKAAPARAPEPEPDRNRGLTGLDAHYARIASAMSQIPISPKRLIPPGCVSLPQRLNNMLGMEFVLIYPTLSGEGFVMFQDYRIGPADQGFQALASQPFYLQTTPVTQSQWRSLMQNAPAHHDQDPRQPVEQVSWDDCQLFIHLLNHTKEANYRLPSEVEWDFACRAGSSGDYYFGPDPAALGDYAWFAGNAGERPHPVAGKRPNAFKLFDMLGNVREWVQDRYQSEGQLQRVVRGGGFEAAASDCHAGLRQGETPQLRRHDLGFRLVIEAS